MSNDKNDILEEYAIKFFDESRESYKKVNVFFITLKLGILGWMAAFSLKDGNNIVVRTYLTVANAGDIL